MLKRQGEEEEPEWDRLDDLVEEVEHAANFGAVGGGASSGATDNHTRGAHDGARAAGAGG